jgi:membrane-bound lytic murein transglycosylase D
MILRFLILCLISLSRLSILYSMQPQDPPAPTFVPESQASEASFSVSHDPEELYLQLSDDRREFEEGIRLIMEGQRDLGEQKTVAAQDRLFAGFRKCTTINGCDIEKFFDAISELLELQQDSLSENIDEETGYGESTEISPPREPATSRSSGSQSLLRGKDLRELIELNEQVKAAMNDWMTWLRPQLMDSYQNYQYLRDKIAPIYEEAGLPEALLFALIATETGGKVHAVSSAGAAGLFQFMSGTGKRYGLTVEDGFDMRLDPVEATKASIAFLNEQMETLNQNLEKTLAAYNSGENRLRRLNRKFKGVDFWDSRFYNSLPNETRMYVPRILAAAWLFLHPEDYNLRFGSFQTETISLTLKRDTALDQLSICLGQTHDQRDGWFRTLRNLNPRLEYQDEIKAGQEIQIPTILKEAYQKNCLEGDLLERAHELHEARFPELIIYTVVKGDSLIKIANRFGCSTQEIAVINNLRAPRYLIRIGQKLKIPGRY